MVLAAQSPGEHGLLALDWHSGNRSVLVDHELSGLLVGVTLATRPEDVYRALVEATAFGMRTILEAFAAAGVPVAELIVTGGLVSNAFLMQLYSDVLGRPLSVIASRQGPALGAAIHAAVAAGEYPDVPTASHAMARSLARCLPAGPSRWDRLRPAVRRVLPPARPLRPRRRRRHARARRSASGRADRPSAGGEQAMSAVTAVADSINLLRTEVAALHGELTRNGLVVWTAGNISARVPGTELMVIKPSGVRYEELSADSIVVTDLDGVLVDGDRSPSSDTAAHAYVYRHMPQIGGVVHTHSTYATAWAARGEPIPCVLTMAADEFGGDIPIGPFALIGDDSIGQGLVETLKSSRSPAVLMRNHGVFTVGMDAGAAVKAAVMCEDVARTVHVARQLGEPVPLDPADIDALFDRYQHVYGRGPAERP